MRSNVVVLKPNSDQKLYAAGMAHRDIGATWGTLMDKKPEHAHLRTAFWEAYRGYYAEYDAYEQVKTGLVPWTLKKIAMWAFGYGQYASLLESAAERVVEGQARLMRTDGEIWCGQPESNRHGIAPSGF